MKIGRYETLDELGRGATGVVYRARGEDGELVAIKLLKPESAEARARFSREARLLRTLGAEEAFVPLLEHGEREDGAFLVMPLLEGGTLRDLLERGPLEEARAIRLARAVGAALFAAHLKGIVHRDVKPENILFTGDGVPLVADLGLAKHMEGSLDRDTLAISSRGAFRGTAGYMAPEQMEDAASVGPSADVFALGALLYECLAGVPAFTGASVLQVIERVDRCEYPPLREVRPEVPAWLEAVVDRSLGRNPRERYAHGGAFAAPLETKSSRLARQGAPEDDAASAEKRSLVRSITRLLRRFRSKD